MHLRRTVISLSVVPLAAAAVVLPLVSPSQAEARKLLVSGSADGPFHDQLSRPLFKGDSPFVPRDRASSTFYVKNNSGDAARATVAVVNHGASGAFENALTFGIDVAGTTSTGAVPAPGGEGCAHAVTGASIEPGGVQSVALTLAVADLVGQEGMDQAASLDVVVTLTQVGRSGQVHVCGEQAEPEPEPDGEQGGEGSGDPCRRDVVVTVVGEPSCVPTVVDAGATYGMGDPRGPGTVAFLAAVLVSIGAGMLLLAGRRQRRTA